jgi:hypothetical protein
MKENEHMDPKATENNTKPDGMLNKVHELFQLIRVQKENI